MDWERHHSPGKGASGYLNGHHHHGGLAVLDPVQVERRFTLIEVELLHQGARLDRIEKAQSAISRRISRAASQSSESGPAKASLPSAPAIAPTVLMLLRHAFGNAGQWAGTILAASYIAKGGDAGTALKFVADLLKSLG
jgi:hypothetical protein